MKFLLLASAAAVLLVQANAQNYAQVGTILGQFSAGSNVGKSPLAVGPFVLSDSALFNYGTVLERESLLQSVLGVFQTSFPADSFGITNLQISFIREYPDAGGKGVNQVVYKISGVSTQPLDLHAVLLAFQAAVRSATLAGISNVPSNFFDDSNKPVLNTTWSVATSGSIFVIVDSVLLYGVSVRQRDNLLPQVVVLMQRDLSGLYLSNVNVNYLGEDPNKGQNQQVLYEITGQAATQVDVTTIHGILHASQYAANIKGLTTISGNLNSGTNVGGQFSIGDFAFTDSVLLTYTTVAERDAILQSILAVFQRTFASLSITDTSIVFVRESPFSGAATQVWFKIHGTATAALDVSTLTKSFQVALSTAKVSGASGFSYTFYLNDQPVNTIPGAVLFSGSAFSLLQSVLLTFNSTEERTYLLLQALTIFQAMVAEYGLSNLNINYEGHSNITIDGGNQVLFSVTGLSSKPFDISNILAMYDVAIENGHITGLNTGSATIGKFQYSDSVGLVYTTFAQRDALLASLLDNFKTTFASVGFIGLKISYVRESAASNGIQVTFKISGQTTQPTDISHIPSVFMVAIKNANLPGISVISGGIVIEDQVINPGATIYSGIQITLLESIQLVYNGDTVPKNVSDDVLTIFRSITNQYAISNLLFHWKGTAPGPGGSVNTVFRITGVSVYPIDVSTLHTNFISAVQRANASYITINEVVTYTYQLTDSVVLTYDTPAQRDDLLNQLVILYKKTYPDVTSANVVYLLEQPANAGSTLVYYKIIGQSSHPVTVVDSTISEWHSTVYTQQIPNISIVDVVYTPTVPLPSPVPIPVPVLVIPASPWDGVYGVAFDGTVWAVELSCGTIRRGINGTWDNLGLSPVQNIAWAQVAGRGFNEAVAVNIHDQAFQYLNGQWAQLGASCGLVHIDIGLDGSIWAVNRAGDLLSWSENAWQSKSVSNAISVSVYNSSRIVYSNQNKESFVLSASANGWDKRDGSCSWALAGESEEFCIQSSW